MLSEQYPKENDKTKDDENENKEFIVESESRNRNVLYDRE